MNLEVCPGGQIRPSRRAEKSDMLRGEPAFVTVEFLIQAIVHQTTVLIAQLATLGGGRAPLAQVANQVFLDLVRELQRQGVSRKVSADMFGLGLRTYRRKIQRLSESSTERGRSLWEVVLEYIRSREQTTRGDLLLRFALDDEAQVRAVVHDLCESGLVLASGEAAHAVYRASSEEELEALRNNQSSDGQDDLLIALMYREGPLTVAEIAQKAQLDEGRIEGAIQRLAEAGRIQSSAEGGTDRYEAKALVIPFGAPIGWEAAVLDHYKAMVKTVLTKLQHQDAPSIEDAAGGSTYTIDIWPGHPLEDEVRGALKEVRSRLSDLRRRVARTNESEDRPSHYDRVVVYAGQSVIREEDEEASDETPHQES